MQSGSSIRSAELAEIFDISGISKSPAVFDINKLRWMNAEYMKKLSPEAFFSKAEPVLKSVITNPAIDLKAVAALVQPRCEILSDLPERVDFIDKLPVYSTDLYVHKKSKTTLENSLSSLQAVLPVLEGLETWTNEALLRRTRRAGSQAGGQELHHSLAAARSRIRQSLDARRRNRIVCTSRQGRINRTRENRHRTASKMKKISPLPLICKRQGPALPCGIKQFYGNNGEFVSFTNEEGCSTPLSGHYFCSCI